MRALFVALAIPLAVGALAATAAAEPVLTGSTVTLGIDSSFTPVISPSTSAVVVDPGSEFATGLTAFGSLSLFQIDVTPTGITIRNSQIVTLIYDNEITVSTDVLIPYRHFQLSRPMCSISLSPTPPRSPGPRRAPPG